MSVTITFFNITNIATNWISTGSTISIIQLFINIPWRIRNKVLAQQIFSWNIWKLTICGGWQASKIIWRFKSYDELITCFHEFCIPRIYEFVHEIFFAS